MAGKEPVLFVVLLQLACVGSKVERQGNGTPGWESYRAQARIVSDSYGQYYVVEGDLIFLNEHELREYYENYVARGHSGITSDDDLSIRSSQLAVMTRWSTGYEPTFVGSDAQDIVYCVSDSFASKGTVVADMAVATKEWMEQANVVFRYEPAQDVACHQANDAVDFAVVPTTVVDGCGANKMMWAGNGCLIAGGVRVKGVLTLKYGGSPIGTGITWAGVAKHELGHILGFRHEDPWGAAPCEYQTIDAGNVDLSGRRLTDYDQSSVMHYPECGGIAGVDFHLTAMDGMGVRQIYGMPASWYVPTILSI